MQHQDDSIDDNNLEKNRETYSCSRVTRDIFMSAHKQPEGWA